MIRRFSKLPSYLTQAEIRALFTAISNLRDRTLFGLRPPFTCSTRAKTSTSPGIIWGIGRSSRP